MKLVIEIDADNRFDAVISLSRFVATFQSSELEEGHGEGHGDIYLAPKMDQFIGSWRVEEGSVTCQYQPGDSCRFIRLAPHLVIVKHADDCEVFAPGVYTDPRQERSDPVITASAIRHLKAQFPDAAW